jgi:hypothetical protein
MENAIERHEAVALQFRLIAPQALLDPPQLWPQRLNHCLAIGAGIDMLLEIPRPLGSKTTLHQGRKLISLGAEGHRHPP